LVVLPLREDDIRDLFAEGNPGGSRWALRNFLKRCRVGFLDFRFLPGVLPHQNITRSRNCRGLGRSVQISLKSRGEARVAVLDCVDRVGHGHVHDRHAASPGIASDIDRFHDVDRGLVPIGDDVGVKRRRR
jgi:hypothetical protein